MRKAYFDCIGGASGDMLLGALVDAGASKAVLRSTTIEALGLADCDIRFQRVTRAGIGALQAIVETPRSETPRRLRDLLEIIERADLASSIKKKALEILRRIGQVEADIHQAELENVHLHELGGDDTLIDVVGVLAALDELGIERVHVSPLPLGRGFVESAHGKLPLPAPATLALLKGVPVHYSQVEKELVTPTGAALLTGIADGFGGFPPMRLERIGVGAGGRELPFPNVVRLWLGISETPKAGLDAETLVMIETNIDDMNPQRYGYIMERLFSSGALDVTLTPVQMKKNRPGILLNVLCQPERQEEATQIIFRETTTLGVRRYPVERLSLPRRIETVETPYGPIRVKISNWEEIERASPEYDDCVAAARKYNVPLAEVFSVALDSLNFSRSSTTDNS